jgi:hypothetical protein
MERGGGIFPHFAAPSAVAPANVQFPAGISWGFADGAMPYAALYPTLPPVRNLG